MLSMGERVFQISHDYFYRAIVYFDVYVWTQICQFYIKSCFEDVLAWCKNLFDVKVINWITNVK